MVNRSVNSSGSSSVYFTSSCLGSSTLISVVTSGSVTFISSFSSFTTFGLVVLVVVLFLEGLFLVVELFDAVVFLVLLLTVVLFLDALVLLLEVVFLVFILIIY